MRRRLAKLLPQKITAQLAVVVVVSVVIIQVAVSAMFHFLGEPTYDPVVNPHLGTLVRMVIARPAGEDRGRFVAEIDRTFPSLQIHLDDHPPTAVKNAPPPPAGHGRGRMIDDLSSLAPAGLVQSGTDDESVERGEILALGLSPTEWLVLTAAARPPQPLIGPAVASTVFAVICSSLLGLWAMRALVGPLRALATAAREFDIEAEPLPLPDRGPDEVRVAVRAFDAMRGRIRVLVEERTRMLAAMGHDLRTPITRLRLRSEFIPNDDLRREVLHDLELMTGMIEGALTYLREGRHDEAPELVDLVALVQTLADQWADLGHAIDFTGPDHLKRRVRSRALTRALANLVDNAAKYGSEVHLRLIERPDGAVRIEVEDDGPGIPEAEREAMLRPFVRGDAARNMDDTDGFGLGLAIARAAVEAHGGTLTLLAAVPHGALARVDLPGLPDPARAA
ncbi:HAMP domain-containing protein [Siculibacillus lacustris]|uniref:histidine kinase n=1 Tax=Siculibacillus lacustris TaxID=1549641 RepID=A0A4Q9VML1_9HYPH|nr:ATP-binding protein [Siculibacillus lacustris]TBW36580.1 HAMP domain-containing protein [Siculibacillus lacustris]